MFSLAVDVARKENAVQIGDTVVITTSIMTEIGSSKIPRSICRYCVKQKWISSKKK
jgi:hypothetical protein